MTKFSSLLLVGLLASLSSAVAASWSIGDFNLQVISRNGAKKADHILEYPNAASSVLSADASDSLKFSFKIQNKERPHQAMVLFQSQDEHKDEIMVAASVKVSGKGRFELDFSKSDRKFRYGTRKYDMTFLVGGPKISEPFRYSLGEIEVQSPINPTTRPVRVEYHSRPEIHHQFRSDQKLISTAISGAFTLLVLSPFAVLFFLWSQLGINFAPLKALVQNPLDLISAVVFFGSLVGIEYVFYSYWTHVTLFPVLQALGGLTVVAAVSGRSALSSVQARRLKRTSDK